MKLQKINQLLILVKNLLINDTLLIVTDYIITTICGLQSNKRCRIFFD